MSLAVLTRRRLICGRCSKPMDAATVYCACGGLSERRIGLLTDVIKEISAASQLLYRAGRKEPLTDAGAVDIWRQIEGAKLATLENHLANAKKDRGEARATLRSIEALRTRVARQAARIGTTLEDIEDDIGPLGRLKPPMVERLTVILDNMALLGGDLGQWWPVPTDKIRAEIEFRRAAITMENMPELEAPF